MRRFVRIREKCGLKRSFVLVIWDGGDEDWPRFLSIPAELSGRVPFMPVLYRSDRRHGLILEEDLGETTLHAFSAQHRNDLRAIEAAYHRVLDALAQWQSLDPASSPTIASRSLDEEVFLWETDYFGRRCVTDFCGCERLLGAEWERERHALARAAASMQAAFVHRDFQSENVMLQDGRIRFVDFQGARLGPPAYDLASLLYDPYADFLDDGFSGRLFTRYSSLDLKIKTDRTSFALCAAQRLMQACGAYGNLSIHKGKVRYRKYMPVALGRLMSVLREMPDFPATRGIVEQCRASLEQSRNG